MQLLEISCHPKLGHSTKSNAIGWQLLHLQKIFATVLHMDRDLDDRFKGICFAPVVQVRFNDNREEAIGTTIKHPPVTMVSTRKSKPVVTRGKQVKPRLSPENIPNNESSSVDDSSSSDGSSSYDGLSSEEEPAEVSVGTSASGQDDGVSTDGEGSVSTARFSLASQDPLPRLLASDETLTRMDINHRHLREWSSALPIEDIMVEIARQPSLRTLCFEMENVAMSNYDVLLECVGHMQSLEELLLENAKVNRHTGNAIAAALFRNPNSLRELTLRNCTFAGSGFAIMFLGVQHLPSLTHLSIEECSMQGFASEILSATIPFLKNLKSLKLINTKLPEEGLRYLCDNLIRSSTLVELDLSQNEFDVQSMSWLVGCLQSPDTVIEKLSLNKCRLDSSCVEILSRGLSDDHKLLSMSLNNNTFGDSGARCLVKMLKTNHNLQTLSLKGCEISKKLLKQLHNGIRYNNSFLKNVFSSEVSLAILDSFSMVEKVPETFG